MQLSRTITSVPLKSAPEASRRLVTTAEEYFSALTLRTRLLGYEFAMSKWAWIVPLVLGVLAAVLRMTGLDHPHKLIFDETYYVKDAYSLINFGTERQWGDEPNEAFIAGNPQPSDDPAYVVHPPLGKWLIGLGMLAFGDDNGYGWRMASAVAGTLSVVLVAFIGQYMFRSVFLGGLAGLLLAVEGHHIVMSRSGLLDIFLCFFILAAFGALLVDRHAARDRLARQVASAYRDGKDFNTFLKFGPWLGIRGWRILAGILLGAAVSVKLSGLAFVAVMGLMTVLWDANARKVVGVKHWLRAAVVKDGPYAFVSIVGVGALTYLASWSGWLFTSGGYYRDWAAKNPTDQWWGALTPDWLRSLVHYHLESSKFHAGLSSEHSYASNPWTWPFMGRPVSFHYTSDSDTAIQCGADKCSEAILDLANPLLWWAGLISILFLAGWWFIRPDYRIGAILGMYLAGQLVWALWPERTMFFFYTIAYTPFLVLAVVYCLGAIMRWAARRSRDFYLFATSGVLVFVLLVLAVSAFFLPIWVGESIPYDSWRLRMWLRSWI